MPISFQCTKVSGQFAADISIELGDYIRAYLNYDKARTEYGKDSLIVHFAQEFFRQIRKDLVYHFSDFNAFSLWPNVFNLIIGKVSVYDDSQVLIGSEQQESERNKRIEESAVFGLMPDGFIEIVKNVIDETISKHLMQSAAFPLAQDKIFATLRITIDDETDPECVSIIFKDNGRGFNKNMLNLNEKSARLAYISTRGSHEKGKHTEVYLGGRGLGLRHMMAKIDAGGHLESNGQISRIYHLPIKSNFTFSNHMDENGCVQGAVLSITTEKKPLEPLAFTKDDDSDSYEEMTSSSSFSRSRSSDSSIKNRFGHFYENRSSSLSILTNFSEEVSLDEEQCDSPAYKKRFHYT